MPREQITLENFSAGIVTTVDAQDTPINSASWSVDQDPEVPQGILRGREGDDITADAANNHNGSTFTWIVREDGKRDFIYYSKTTGKLCSIADFFGTPSFATAVTLSTGMQTSLEANNRSVRLGQGNNDVKYYGYIDHGQFGAAAPSGLQYINAKLSEAILFPYLYKSCGTDGTYIYGIEWKGKKVYKVNTSTGVFTAPSTGLYEILVNNAYATGSATNNWLTARIMVNGSSETETTLAITPYSGTTYSSLVSHTIVQMTSGQTAYINIGGLSGTMTATVGSTQTTLKIIRLN